MQPTPSVTGADVIRIVHRDFEGDSVPAVLAMLDGYGTESWHRELWRVRLAVLKLADGSLDGLRSALDIARVDYRDVLALAEYPSCFRHSPREISDLGPDERRALTESDWRQYQDWLSR